MDNQEILATLNAVSEAIVFADASDLQTYATIHTHLEQTADWARAQGLDRASRHVEQAAHWVEQIILGELSDPDAALRAVGATVEAVQGIARDGRSESDVAFPEEFQTVAAAEGSAPEATSAAVDQATDTHAARPAKSRALEGDPDLLAEFITEAREHLDNADVHLLIVESNPKDPDALNAVFRAFHTIKGVAGFLALDDVQALAHQAENLLDKARKEELDLAGGNIDLTFESVDFMKRLIQSVSDSLSTGDELPVEPALPNLVERLAAATAGAPPPPANTLPDIKGERIGEILVEAGLADPDSVDYALDRQFLREENLQLGELLVRDVVISRSQLEQALALQEQHEPLKRLGEILVEMGAARSEDIERVLQKQDAAPAPMPIGEILIRSGDAEAKDVALALRSQKQRQGPVEVKEAVRVDADRLDRMIDLVGELVIAESMVRQSIDVSRITNAQLSRQLGQLDKITRELQEMGTSLRMVPVRTTFQKMARLVRDLAKKAGKQVEFVTEGEDTELDKTVVEKIGDPLVHMIRNSCDHGLEASPEERQRAGKAPLGRVTLRAFHKGGSIYIEIEDDGRGLDRDAILAKARERGLIRDTETPTDREVWNLIFEPGFSTAKVVTDVSGRGVGMDVVRRNIEYLRGQIEIHSEKGKGSVFSIRLPLTLAIIEGMVIRVGDERYIVPTLSVIRSIQPKPGQISTIVGRGEVLTLQGELIPLFRLNRLFGIPGCKDNATEALVMIVENEGRKVGMLIDALVGQQQIVIKSLGQAMQDLDGVAGGAIMSDGTVGLILDVGGIVELAAAIRNTRSSAPDVPVQEANVLNESGAGFASSEIAATN
jgi:two-component system chemotaxis sensor kinase CheA